MGRTERRAKERADRKNIKAREEELTKDISRMFLVCFAMAERKTYGFGQKRLLRSLKSVDELMNDIFKGNATLEDYEKQLKEEVDIVISVK